MSDTTSNKPLAGRSHRLHWGKCIGNKYRHPGIPGIRKPVPTLWYKIQQRGDYDTISQRNTLIGTQVQPGLFALRVAVVDLPKDPVLDLIYSFGPDDYYWVRTKDTACISGWVPETLYLIANLQLNEN